MANVLTGDVTNRLEGLDLVGRVHEELWTEVCDIIQEAVINHPQEKEMQRGKTVVC